MCILCVVQKWSRKVATMLPWLVIPLIGLWALSQLLPPGYRFEVTSPRLACVLVLLVTLFWYEVLMPRLSKWRAHRSARLRELKRFEAIELQKLRKTATRRCRNCYTPYRDQNPSGGKFMCSYCGHISKRPVLDIPSPAMLGISNSGIGKIWNGKAWSENGWICGQDWSENGNWAPSFGGKSNYLGRNGPPYFGGDSRYSPEKPYSGVFVFGKLLSYFFLSLRWLWRKIFRVSSTGDDGSLDAENEGMLSGKGENGANFHESRGEKARRKAEEKRQARMERELLEEEERKQREEVARLVEERRKLRDEQLEAEKERDKGSTPDKERGNRREAERRRQEKRKEKDRGSSKSNSDVEDMERKSNRENERKRDFEKRSEIERRDIQKNPTESVRVPSSDTGHAIKSGTNNFSRVSGGGSRYFDRMKGSFLSSSKAFDGAGFFGRAVHNSATTGTKVNKPTGFGEHIQSSANRREVHSAEHINGKFTMNGEDKAIHISSHRPVGSDVQPRPAVQKKSWQQLFIRSPTTTSSLDTNSTIGKQSQSCQSEAQNLQLPDQTPFNYHLNKQINFGLPMTCTNSPLSTGSMKSSSASPPVPAFPLVGGPAHDFMFEEAEVFEDPCYVPDPASLLGPVSESLDNFPLDLGTGFITNTRSERPHALKNMYAAADVNRPAPIESPFSRSRVTQERPAGFGQPQSITKSWDQHALPLPEASNAPEHGTWQMWGTPPLGQEGLGLTGGPASWLLPLGQNKPNRREFLHQSSHEAMVSPFATENQVINGHVSSSPQNVCVGGCHNGRCFCPLDPVISDNDLWLQKTVYEPFSGERQIPFPSLNPHKDLSQNDVTCDSPSNAEAIHLFERSPANGGTNRDWAVQAEGEGSVGSSSSLALPHIGGLFSDPDVHSLWSYSNRAWSREHLDHPLLPEDNQEAKPF